MFGNVQDMEAHLALSPLQVDLAKSMVGVAAMKLIAGETLEPADFESAAYLKEYYDQQQQVMTDASAITPDLVPEDSMRQALQKTFCKFLGPRQLELNLDVSDLARLIKSLDKLSKGETLEREESQDLVNLLLRTEPKVNANGVVARLPRF